MKNWMRVMAVLLVGVVAVALGVGCGRKMAEKGTKAGHLVIFSQCNNAEPYRAAQNGMLKKLMAAHEDIELVITDAQADSAKQISQIETAIKQKPDVLIVAPMERVPLTEVMGRAVAAGIPTICLERDIVQPNYTTFVRCDNRKIGRMAGQYIVDHLTKKYGAPRGKLVELWGNKGVQAAQDRHDGLHDVLAKHKGIKVVHDAVANWFQDQAMPRMTEALTANPQIDVLYAHNDPMAIGAYLAAKEKKREKDILFVGVDAVAGPAGGIKKVMDGALGVTFYYPLCVDKAALLIDKMIHDESFVPEKEYMMESAVVSPANAAEMYEKYSSE